LRPRSGAPAPASSTKDRLLHTTPAASRELESCAGRVSIRQHASAHASPAFASIRQHTSACVSACIASIRQHASAFASIRQHTSACVSACIASIRQHASAHASRQLQQPRANSIPAFQFASYTSSLRPHTLDSRTGMHLECACAFQRQLDSCIPVRDPCGELECMR
jgi:hypothetical protein